MTLIRARMSGGSRPEEQRHSLSVADDALRGNDSVPTPRGYGHDSVTVS